MHERLFTPDFAGRTALVTGGSRGIAAEISRALAACGARVAVNFSADADNRFGGAGAAERLVGQIGADGGSAVSIERNLMEAGSGTALVRAAEDQLGAVDTLVLSASMQIHRPFLSQSAANVADQLRLNIVANIEILQAALPAMIAGRYGRILVIGSIQEVAPTAEMPIYSMTKAALRNLTENIATQAAPHGVMVNDIAPGLIRTDRNAFRRQDPAAWEAAQRQANPVGRAGEPQDLTALSLFLLSPANSFTTGATIYSTGGAHIARGGADWAGMEVPDNKEETAAE